MANTHPTYQFTFTCTHPTGKVSYTAGVPVSEDAEQTTWPEIGVQLPEYTIEQHAAQLGKEAAQLQALKEQSLVPFSILIPFLESCVELAKKAYWFCNAFTYDTYLHAIIQIDSDTVEPANYTKEQATAGISDGNVDSDIEEEYVYHKVESPLLGESPLLRRYRSHTRRSQSRPSSDILGALYQTPPDIPLGTPTPTTKPSHIVAPPFCVTARNCITARR
ncbi:hypothetical protein RJ035_007075 [Blastomyces gilchristii]